MKNWQTKERTVFLSGVARFEELYEVAVRVLLVDPSSVVLVREGSEDSEKLELAGVGFASLSGAPSSSLIVALDLAFPDGRSVVLSERRSK